MSGLYKKLDAVFKDNSARTPYNGCKPLEGVSSPCLLNDQSTLYAAPFLFRRTTSPWLLLPQCSGKAIQRLPLPCFRLASEKGSGNLYVAFDGTHGAPFQTVLQRAVDALEQAGHSVSLISSGSYLKSGEELREFFAANITDNRAFGYFTDGSIEDYFRDGAREEAARRLDEAEPGADSAAFCIVFGPGAYWLGEGRFDLSFYLDVSREYQQAGHRQEPAEFRP